MRDTVEAILADIDGRYDKLAENILAMVKQASMRLRLRAYEAGV